LDYQYNFIVFFARYDYDRAILGNDSEHVRIYKDTFCGCKLLERLFHLHWAYSINQKIDLPLKRIWFRKMYRQTFDNDLPLCFIYMGSNSICYDSGFCDFVRKKDGRNRQVILHEDLISKSKNADYDQIKKKVDLCITYDKHEAEKYGIKFFPSCTYQKILNEPFPKEYDQDIYFLGTAKDRLDRIMAVYRYLHQNGVVCKFLIAGVPTEKRVKSDGIQYLDKYISYEENLKNVIRSKCLLEITQLGASNSSLRTLEAIAYGRRIVTDCGGIDDNWFHHGQIQHFYAPQEINVHEIIAPMEPNMYSARIQMNPEDRLAFIQAELEKMT